VNERTVNRLLTGILIVLVVSVLSTGGLAAYLTLNREPRESALARASSATEAAGQTDTPSSEPSPADSAPTTGDTGEAAGGTRIAFVSDQEGDVAIYTMLPDGSDPRRVSTSEREFCAAPVWSPDGTRLAYIAADEGSSNADDAPVGVWVSAADGSEHVQISSGISNTIYIHPTWSPDGTRVAFVSEGETAGEDAVAIHIARSDGSGVERTIAFPRPIQLLLWSPTRDELLVVSGDPHASDRMIVHVMPSDGSQVTQVFENSLAADWTQDGESVVVGDLPSQQVLALQLGEGRAQGGQELITRPIAETLLQPVEIAWSPTGDHVAVASSGHYRQGYATTLHVVTVESGELTTVSEGDGWVQWLGWSPDGRNLVFTRGELGRTPGLPLSDVWVYDVASGRSEPRTSAARFEGDAKWSP
jgi:dipeptidyl aminopeptidase/acylaminoacyl peptidase